MFAENCEFFIPPAFNVPDSVSLLEYYDNGWFGKLEWHGYAMMKKLDDIFSRFDKIPVCDRRRTSCDSVVCNVHTHSAVKTAGTSMQPR